MTHNTHWVTRATSKTKIGSTRGPKNTSWGRSGQCQGQVRADPFASLPRILSCSLIRDTTKYYGIANIEDMKDLSLHISIHRFCWLLTVIITSKVNILGRFRGAPALRRHALAVGVAVIIAAFVATTAHGGLTLPVATDWNDPCCARQWWPHHLYIIYHNVGNHHLVVE